MPLVTAAGALLVAPKSPGLLHIEVRANMELGAAVLSPKRMQLRRIAVFADWESEAALEAFLAAHPVGRRLNLGWHVRLEFLRRWGQVQEYAHLPEIAGRSIPSEPIVALTIARMRLPQLPNTTRRGWPSGNDETSTMNSLRCGSGPCPNTEPGKASRTIFRGRYEPCQLAQQERKANPGSGQASSIFGLPPS